MGHIAARLDPFGNALEHGSVDRLPGLIPPTRYWDAINTIRQQLRSDTSQTNRVRLGRNGFSDLSHNFIGLAMTAYKSNVVEVVNEQDQALTTKVPVSPFVASSGGTTVVAAVVGQAPVPQQTRASRASTRATARAS